MRIATIRLVLDSGDDAEAADAVNEILRERQRAFSPQSSLVDYAIDSITDDPVFEETHGVRLDYVEGDYFSTSNHGTVDHGISIPTGQPVGPTAA